MSDPIAIRARQKLVDTKLWSAVCQTAIEGGAWDKGDLIGDFMSEAEQELLKEREENTDVE